MMQTPLHSIGVFFLKFCFSVKTKSHDFEFRASLLTIYIEKDEWLHLHCYQIFTLATIRMFLASRNIKTCLNIAEAIKIYSFTSQEVLSDPGVG